MRYRTIVADPPWDIGSGGRHSGSRWRRPGEVPSELPYPTMSVEEIKALPVSDHAEPDAHLYLWTINKYVESAYAVARAWSFRPSVLLTWTKTPRGIGLGGTFSQTTEHVLFARRGSLSAKRRVDSTWWNWTRPHNSHSQKPDGFLDLVESTSPGPYLEMFSRRSRLGWDTWGDEALGGLSLLGGAA